MENLSEKSLIELKSLAYDLSAELQFKQIELNKVNQLIYEKTKLEESKSKDQVTGKGVEKSDLP